MRIQVTDNVYVTCHSIAQVTAQRAPMSLVTAWPAWGRQCACRCNAPWRRVPEETRRDQEKLLFCRQHPNLQSPLGGTSPVGGVCVWGVRDRGVGWGR